MPREKLWPIREIPIIGVSRRSAFSWERVHEYWKTAKKYAGSTRVVPSAMTKGNCMHERYEEMCAIATLGELPEAEFIELQEHLVVCDSCQQLYREFCQISTDYLGSLAADSLSKPSLANSDLDPEGSLSKCLARAALEERTCTHSRVTAETQPRKEFSFALFSFVRGRRFAYSLAGVAVLCAASFVGFEISRYQAQSEISGLRTRLLHVAGQNLSPPLPQTTVRMAESSAKMSEELRDVSARYARLSRERRQIEEKLTSATDRLRELGAEAQTDQNQHRDELAFRAGLQARLSDSQERLNTEEQTVADLEQKLRMKEQEVAELAAKESPSVSDDEAKRLFAARDLHIVDVYDVDGHGKTRQSFGRVYYVEKKLLLFYAFDLEDRKHNRAAAAFQAWGYKEANAGTPQSLGLFYVDDATLNRWVLKVNNPKILEHVDVVFVTLEPPQGSSSPKGRRLLYANLGGAPNHP